MARTINIQPVTRIEGHAKISIHLDDNGNVNDTRLAITSLRGFEKFIEGRPAEEVVRIVTRICGICPWMHHLAANKAVEGCFNVSPPPTGHHLREMCQVMAHVNDKILHFFFLAAPDFLIRPDSDYSVRSVVGLMKKAPKLTARFVEMRQLSQMMLERFAGKAIHPVAGVVGGFAKPLLEDDRKDLLRDSHTLLDFARYALDFAKEHIFTTNEDLFNSLGSIKTGFLGTVDPTGGLNLYDGPLRLMHPNGDITDFSSEKYLDYVAEHVEPWGYGKMPYAKVWDEGFSMDLAQPRGVYRVNSLARINVCDHIPTPLAQEALEEFRDNFSQPAQNTMLYHWARLIELIYSCERTIELLEESDITGSHIRTTAKPKAGRGVGHVEAPRGTLIHDYQTDSNGCIVKANMIVGTTHNISPMNMSVKQAATSLIKNGTVDDAILNKVEMAVRAYDP